MNRLILLLITLASTRIASGATYTAAAATRQAVLDAYELCGDGVGDILAIPAGVISWDTRWIPTKAITIQGAGVGQTIIYDDITNSSAQQMIAWQTSAGKEYRLTGIEFRGSFRDVTGVASTNVITSAEIHGLSVNQEVRFTALSGGAGLTNGISYYVKTAPSTTTFTVAATAGGAEIDFTSDITAGRWYRPRTGWAEGCLGINGASSAVRIDQCEFENLQSENIYWYNSFGVIDNCTFELNAGGKRAVMFNHREIFGSSNTHGDASWEAAMTHGQLESLYFEDNLVFKTATTASGVYGMADATRGGGRMVFRNNIFTNTQIANHGTESSQRWRGGRAMEIYRNTFDNWFTPSSSLSEIVTVRSGTIIAWNNRFTGTIDAPFKLNSYRLQQSFAPWGQADGTKAWDTANTSDVFGTPGDGIFETGNATAGTTLNTLIDSSKSWMPNEWVNYTARQIIAFTATSGGVRSITVSGAGWAANSWIGYEVTKLSDGSKSLVSSHTSDTLTLSASYYPLDMTGGGDFVLSMGGLILSNTETTLNLSKGIETGSDRPWKEGYPFEIRKLAIVLDDPGAGATTPIAGGSTPNHQSLGQTLNDPCLFWDNLKRTTPAVSWGSASIANVSPQGQIAAGTNYFYEGAGITVGTLAARPSSGLTIGQRYWATDSGEWDSTNGATPDGQLFTATGTTTWAVAYTPYTYPHPLRSGGADITPPTIQAAAINGAALTIQLSESATGGAAAQFALNSGSLSSYAINGATITMTRTPAAENGDVLTVSYTPGDIEDASSNAMEAQNNVAVTNNTPPPPTDPDPPFPGRKGRGPRAVMQGR